MSTTAYRYPNEGLILFFTLTLVLVVISIYGFVMAYQKHHWRLPILGDYAKKIKL